MWRISVHSLLRDYEVIANGSAKKVDAVSDFNDSEAICIIDSIVWNLHKKGLLSDLSDAKIVTLDVSEEIKYLETVEKLYKEILSRGVKRSTRIIVIGGGITQDVCGFVASTLFRGLTWTFVPTTLLAQVDSCIGGKTSLNFQSYKNLLGTFYPPSKVEIYPQFLDTLSEKDFSSGLGEIIKLHIIAGERKFLQLKSNLPSIHIRDETIVFNMICSSLEIKKSFIEEDEFDAGKRRFLNYGHSFGHAIEAGSAFRIPHGQAVIIGMVLANIVSSYRNLLSEKTNYELNSLLIPSLYIKPTFHELNTELVINGLLNDKKRSGSKLALVILKEGFEMELIQDLDVMEVEIALSRFKELVFNRRLKVNE